MTLKMHDEYWTVFIGTQPVVSFHSQAEALEAIVLVQDKLDAKCAA